ncbi:hypothetical protein HCA64_03125 [Listeria booriae]|uniref:Uncharacterized protein n=1 Tax=Listeria booriae TaxID=1552123 RepID=A0A099W8W1_9LIST|nr:T7SS effector LXG polymorphic toxin [Listeria booriae]KGL40525.1 hypothetical protein EP57_08185 [Listeria booriae]MBC1905463.1 hypothetical protein [Listeria booriae]MBC1914010.1 hypothetical protein [Listeria booriae]STY41942.1 Uncharacterized protein conserved in bacteria [Listeria booriae]
MSYLIKYDDITSFSSYAGQKLNSYQEQLDTIQASLQGIVSLDQLKGNAADSIKNYLNEVHYTLIISIQQLIAEYQVRLLLYKDGYYQEIDSDLHTQIDEDLLVNKKSFFSTSSTGFENTYSDFVAAISNIQDILPDGSVKPDFLRQDYSGVDTHITKLKEKTGTYEQQHQKDDLTNFKSMLLSIQQLIKENQAKPQGVTTYQAGDLASFPSAAGLDEALKKSGEFFQGNSATIEAASGRENERWDVLQAEYEAELAKEREKNGWLQIVGGAAAFLIGGAAIVLTAGAATPLVVAAVAFGGSAMAYGISEVHEGSENVDYGRAGDAHSFAWNPLRDTVFMGNQDAYNVFGTIAVTGSSIIIPGALAYRSAAKVGQIIGVGEIAGTAMARTAVGEIAGFAINAKLPAILEPYVGSGWATGIGFAAAMVASAGGGAWAARGINSALDIPTTGIFKPRVVADEAVPTIKPTKPLKPVKEIEIVDAKGKPLGEFDEIDIEKGIFYEDKQAKGLNVLNPRTQLPAQTPIQFAEKQIYQKTANRIRNLEDADATRATVNGSKSIPTIEEIRGIKKFIFRLDGDTAELREAVEQSIEKLRNEFPNHSFDVIFGGDK